jgi:ribosomal protein S18 acetylase RimI-like enzyme
MDPARHPVITIRPAGTSDLPAMAEMAADLVRFHHAMDPRRFFLASGIEKGYRDWFGRELASEHALLFVGERAAGAGGALEIDGYAYGRIEPRDWNMLLDRHAALHDVFVHERARKTGLGEQLIRAFVGAAAARGAPRVVLHTATSNTSAQALFAKLGFRPTMIEMTRESD